MSKFIEEGMLNIASQIETLKKAASADTEYAAYERERMTLNVQLLSVIFGAEFSTNKKGEVNFHVKHRLPKIDIVNQLTMSLEGLVPFEQAYLEKHQGEILGFDLEDDEDDEDEDDMSIPTSTTMMVAAPQKATKKAVKRFFLNPLNGVLKPGNNINPFDVPMLYNIAKDLHKRMVCNGILIGLGISAAAAGIAVIAACCGGKKDKSDDDVDLDGIDVDDDVDTDPDADVDVDVDTDLVDLDEGNMDSLFRSDWI